jgi:hypothetical protein
MEGISKNDVSEIINYFSNCNITKQELSYQLYSRCKELDPWLPISDAPLNETLHLFTAYRNEQTFATLSSEEQRKYFTHYKELSPNPKE